MVKYSFKTLKKSFIDYKTQIIGLTPLLIAVSADNMRCVELLITAGADVNCRETKRGWSALHFAVKRNDKDIISLLLKRLIVFILFNILHKFHYIFTTVVFGCERREL